VNRFYLLLAALLLPPAMLSARAEGDLHPDITPAEILRHTEALCAISRESRDAGDILWGRIAGQPAEERAARYVEVELNRYGLEGLDDVPGVAYHAFLAANKAQWLPTRLRVQVQGDAAPLASAMAVEFAGPTPEGGLDAELVDIDLGLTLDAYDLRGRIALLRAIPGRSVYTHSAETIAPELAYRGARGLILWFDGPGWPSDLTYARVPAEWIWIPWVTVSRNDALYLRRRAGSVVHMEVRGDLFQGVRTQNVIGVLPGSGAADEYVLVMAHLDGFFEGANDNASGVAAMLALARHYSEAPRAKRRRTLVFAANGAHHEGGLGAERMQFLLEAAMPGFFSRCALIVNAEHLATANPLKEGRQNPRILMMNRAGGARGRDRIARWFFDGFRRYGLRVDPRVSEEIHGDVRYLIDTGAPLASFMEVYPWYHGSGDDLARFRPEEAARCAKAVAYVIDRLVLGQAARSVHRPKFVVY
jgi:hypothetical protein